MKRVLEILLNEVLLQ